LTPDKREPDAEFEQEFLDVVEQTLFEVALMRELGICFGWRGFRRISCSPSTPN
jgi:hypothetical protein